MVGTDKVHETSPLAGRKPIADNSARGLRNAPCVAFSLHKERPKKQSTSNPGQMKSRNMSATDWFRPWSKWPIPFRNLPVTCSPLADKLKTYGDLLSRRQPPAIAKSIVRSIFHRDLAP
jgi:hypothetical protein